MTLIKGDPIKVKEFDKHYLSIGVFLIMIGTLANWIILGASFIVAFDSTIFIACLLCLGVISLIGLLFLLYIYPENYYVEVKDNEVE